MKKRREVWRETGGEEEHLRREAAELAERERIVSGLAECPECGGKAEAVVFGAEGLGVWVGCNRSAECSRNIEMRTEGWSLAEVAAEWNRYNSGVLGFIRRMKIKIDRHLGGRKRAEKREKARRAAEERAREAELERVFGVVEAEKGRKRRRFWRKGNK